MSKRRKDDNLRNFHPKALEAIATKLTGIVAEVKLRDTGKPDKNIHKRKSGRHRLSKGRTEG
jgi:hypothetical protein